MRRRMRVRRIMAMPAVIPDMRRRSRVVAGRPNGVRRRCQRRAELRGRRQRHARSRIGAGTTRGREGELAGVPELCGLVTIIPVVCLVAHIGHHPHGIVIVLIQSDLVGALERSRCSAVSPRSAEIGWVLSVPSVARHHAAQTCSLPGLGKVVHFVGRLALVCQVAGPGVLRRPALLVAVNAREGAALLVLTRAVGHRVFIVV
mmetsp:Transcript_61375/g.176650  ORF Transcript_61375/g.176650 Transcript_61375/m.176650 type:complete len:203 (+) Transcript_61375:1101-1709(+)